MFYFNGRNFRGEKISRLRLTAKYFYFTEIYFHGLDHFQFFAGIYFRGRVDFKFSEVMKLSRKTTFYKSFFGIKLSY